MLAGSQEKLAAQPQPATSSGRTITVMTDFASLTRGNTDSPGSPARARVERDITETKSTTRAIMVALLLGIKEILHLLLNHIVAALPVLIARARYLLSRYIR
jgi:hypothetical protein